MECFPFDKKVVTSLFLCFIIALANITLRKNGVASLVFYNCVCEYTSKLNMELPPLFCVLYLRLRTYFLIKYGVASLVFYNCVCEYTNGLRMELFPLFKYRVASLILFSTIAFANILIV